MDEGKYRVVEEGPPDTRKDVEYSLNRADEEGYDLVQVVGVGEKCLLIFKRRCEGCQVAYPR